MFDESLDTLLGSQTDPMDAGYRLRELAEKGVDHGPELVQQIVNQREQLVKSDPAIVLRVIHTLLLQSGQETIQQLRPQWLTAIEAALPSQTPNRTLLLQLLAMIRNEESLRELIRLIKSNPPQEWTDGADPKPFDATQRLAGRGVLPRCFGLSTVSSSCIANIGCRQFLGSFGTC